MARRKNEKGKVAIREWLLPIITCILGATIGIIGTDYVNQKKETRLMDKAICAEKKEKRHARLSFYEQMAVNLDGSKFDFDNQTDLRDRLYESLKRNHGPLPNLQYEPLFAKMHSKFTEDEKAICGLMRSITTNSMRRHNEAMIKLIESNPSYRNELTDFSGLQDHLNLWFSKYTRDLEGQERREDICLIYVGVNENKPFPPDIGDAVRQKIKEIKAQQINCNDQ